MQIRLKNYLKKVLRVFLNKQTGITSLITITLSKSALLNNLNEFKELVPESLIAPTLKSNAYGHGVELIAKELESIGAPFFVIDSYFETIVLRNGNIKTPLLVIGYSTTNTILKNNLKDIIFTITSIEALEDLSRNANHKVHIHLKIDTGMHRQGILTEELDRAFELINSNKNILLEGICSHLSDSDGIDPSFTHKQIDIWNNIVEKTLTHFPTLKYYHLSNTYGHQFAKKIKANVYRLGIGLYGLAEIPGLDLKPVLEMKTIVSSVKKIKKSETVGYNNTFTADKDMTIATIPVGYYEGLDRRFSNKGYVKINGIFCKIIGRVSMNISTIDVSELDGPKIGDEVIVFSNIPTDKNSIKSIAEAAGTITYEIVVDIPEKIKRVIV
jgi:alanine racemase